jgi:nucleoside-diphosphate-sugar epimerase
MTTLITGGAGFIGANLAKLLTERNRSFIALDNYTSGNREYLMSWWWTNGKN